MAKKVISKEASLFRLYSSQFKETILDPVVLAGQLYSSQFIDEYTREKVSASSQRARVGTDLLINAVETYVNKQSGKKLIEDFENILVIFKKHIPLKSVVESLEIDYYGHVFDESEHVDEELVKETQLQNTEFQNGASQTQKRSRRRKKKKKSSFAPISIPLEEEPPSNVPIEVPSLGNEAEHHRIGMETTQYHTEQEPTNSEGSLLQPSPFLRDSESPFSMSQADSISDLQPFDASQPMHNIDDIEQENPRFNELVITLRVYSSDLSISGVDTQAILNLFKAHIENHIKKELEDGLSKDAIKKQLNELTMNALIPMDVNDWCYVKLDDLYKEYNDKLEVKDSSGDESVLLHEELPPLFTADAVYHASLCNLALSATVNHSALGIDSIKKCLSQYGHSFDAFSVSLSGNIQMLIAQQGNIVYAAFCCRSPLDTMMSFGDIGKEMPLRYFCELLHQNKRLVLTGFFFGGDNACSILLQLWHQSYFNAEFLHQNVVCIIFGTLPIAPEHIQAFEQDPNILSSCHLFLLEGHMQFMLRVPLLAPALMNFINRYLQDIIYLIHQTRNGLQWTKKFDVRKLNKDDKTKEYSVKVYHHKVLRGYLDKEGYKLPSRNESPICPVPSLVPSITEIELYQHKQPDGNESVIVIKGDDLWFCNGIEIELPHADAAIKIKIFADSVTQKQISYNHLFDDTSFINEEGAKNYCSVKVYSKFANPLISDVPIIYNVPDNISFRQSQLAKQTPSQIISLSFLSALLEQSSTVHSGRPTKRSRQIIKFLQEASSIVPMESAFFAVATTDNDKSAINIAQAIVNSVQQSSIPVSVTMAFGCRGASDRLKHQVLKQYTSPAFKRAVDYYYKRPHRVLVSTNQVHDANTSHHQSRAKKNNKRMASAQKSPSILLKYHDLQLSPIECFLIMCEKVQIAATISQGSLHLICGRNVGELYPISKAVSTSDSDALTPLPQILQNARARLTTLAMEHKETNCAELNRVMLAEVNKIVEDDLKPCVTMLGGFMEQQIKVPLVNNPLDTAKALREAKNFGAVGVWALFALSHRDIELILSSRRNETLLIQIENFIKGSLSEEVAQNVDDTESTTSYNAKLQFLLQGLNKTVTCSSNYISYSLERELVGICKERDISTSASVSSVVCNWDEQFQETALVLVPTVYRPLLARWLIWSLNIHQLREGLASYTTVGVIGLVNSGKSTLVDKVFNVKTVQGTTQSARTTVPFIYNLDSSVEGLSVIDFPGVDDKDESIGGLAKLLVGLAQLVIFVCGYERFHTSSAEEWMKIFQNDFAATPILVCLTHADRLYEEKCDDDVFPECPEPKIPLLKSQFQRELEKIIGSTETTGNCMIKLCSLTQGRRSSLNNDKGRQSMSKVGIFSPEDIGEWIKHALIRDIQQPELADKFESFLTKNLN